MLDFVVGEIQQGQRIPRLIPCIGKVRAGCKADLLLLDANPLSSVGNTRRIVGAMLRGRWLSRQELNRLLESLAPGCQ